MRSGRDRYAQITDGHFKRFKNHPGLTGKRHPSGGPVGAGNEGKPQKIDVPRSGPLLARHEKSSKTLPFSSFLIAAEGLEPPTRGL